MTPSSYEYEPLHPTTPVAGRRILFENPTMKHEPKAPVLTFTYVVDPGEFCGLVVIGRLARGAKRGFQRQKHLRRRATQVLHPLHLQATLLLWRHSLQRLYGLLQFQSPRSPVAKHL